MRDFYEILEVERDCTTAELKKSYKRLAKKYHPDLRPGDEEAEAKFKEINYAYEVLSDEEKRRKYDTFGEEGLNGNFSGGGGFGGFSDIFDDIFDIFGGGGFRTSQQNRKDMPQKGESIRYDITLDFFEAVFGVEKDINIRVEEECEHCHGKGAEPGTGKHTCGKCHGSGQIHVEQNSPFGRFVRTSTCDQCQGSGEIIEEPCKKCRGRGRLLQNKKIHVKFPAGVDNGTVISLKNEGHAGVNGGGKGDLYVYIKVRPDSVFKRNGYDLYLDIPITYPDAVLGGTIKVPTLEKLTDYEIPKGTQGGTTFRLKGEGISYLRKEGKGDLYFTVNIIIPRKVDEKQRDLLEQLRDQQPEAHQTQKGFFEKVKNLFD
ncbi:MAG: molecular chaperone DnaJ [Tissierellia bacterium]|nr:molecular chaperone DnaJ [Tissierellia bacterium]